MHFLRSLLLAGAALSTTVLADGNLVNLDASVLSGGNALVNLGAVVGVLAPDSCSNTDVVGVKLALSVFPLLQACACIDLINVPLLTQQHKCPSCPANATPICKNAGCGCQCNQGYYAAIVNGAKTCVKQSDNCVSPNILTVNVGSGINTCTCARGFIDNLLGGCINACLVV